MEEHVKETLQPAFNQNNKGLKNYPFSNDIKQKRQELKEMKKQNGVPRN